MTNFENENENENKKIAYWAENAILLKLSCSLSAFKQVMTNL